MKYLESCLYICAVFICVAMTTHVSAQEVTETIQTKEVKETTEKKVDLEELMDDIRADFKVLIKGIKRAGNKVDNKSYLAAAQRLHDNAQKSLAAVPYLITEIKDAAVREKTQKAYVADMKLFIAVIVELQKNIQAEDYVAAHKQLMALKKHRNQGHDKYQE